MAKTRTTTNSGAQTVVGTAKSLADFGFSADVIANGDVLLVSSDTALRYLSVDTPTATYGHVIPADETVEFLPDFGELNFISTSGTANITLTIEGFTTS